MTARFESIDIARHFDICQQMRAISYQASFGSLQGFAQEYGESYRHRLQLKIDQLPQACCHLWLDDQIIGQTEAKLLELSDVGYLNLLVLKPEFQRQGYGRLMVDYLSELFRHLGKTRLQLSVSPSNHPAMAFYRNNGWQDKGLRSQTSTMHLMEKSL